MGFLTCYAGDFPKLLDALADHGREIPDLLAHYEPPPEALQHHDHSAVGGVCVTPSGWRPLPVIRGRRGNPMWVAPPCQLRCARVAFS